MISTMVLGVAPFELLEPRAKNVPAGFIDRVLTRMQRQQATPLTNGIDAEEHIAYLAMRGTQSVEIYGLWENKCVFAAVRAALSCGMDVRVPHGYTFPGPDSKETLDERVRAHNLPTSITRDLEFTYLTPRKSISN